MKKRWIAVLLAASCALAGACNTGREGDAGTDRPEGAKDAGVNGQAGPGEEQTEAAAGEGNAPGDGEKAAQQGRSLTEEELAAFTYYVSEADHYGNYGFLLSVYDTPSRIDLNELFYSGAGIGTKAPGEKEREAYLAAGGYEEIHTDLTCLSTEQIDAFLQQKTGLTYAQMEKPLDWIYLEEYDLYCWEHGDTNYRSFTCVSGTTADEKTFTLRFRADEEYTGNGSDSGYYMPDSEAVLEKRADGYRFLSNRIVTEEGLIADQTFSVTLPEIGEAVFASYAPGSEMNPQSDVTFMVQYPDGQLLQILEGPCENNVRAAECFEAVEAVSFPDYNGDGCMDVIAIASYSRIQEPDAGGGFTEARVYSGNSYGYFYYEKDLSRYANETLKDPSAGEVAELLSEGAFYGDWRIASCAGTAGVYGLPPEEADQMIGTRLSFGRDGYVWMRESGRPDEKISVDGYRLREISAEEFEDAYSVPLASLGIDADQMQEIQTVGYGGGALSPGFFLPDQNTLLVAWDGVFFTAVREE